MGLTQEEIATRNADILNDYNQKEKIKDIARKYKITRARVYQILKYAATS